MPEFTTQEELNALATVGELLKKYPAVAHFFAEAFQAPADNPFRHGGPVNVTPPEPPAPPPFVPEYLKGVTRHESFSGRDINIDNIVPRLFITRSTAERVKELVAGASVYSERVNDQESEDQWFVSFADKDVSAGILADMWRRNPNNQSVALQWALDYVKAASKRV